MIDPEAWAHTVIEHLEQRGVVGSLLPGDAAFESDRYVPRRASATYRWTGESSATTIVRFRVESPNHDFIRESGSGFEVYSRISEAWGDSWEDVEIRLSKVPIECDLEYVGRLHVRIAISISEEDDHRFTKRIEIENLRQRGGIIHALRIQEVGIPTLIPQRSVGIQEDSYFRCAGLIGFISEDRTTIEFRPHAILPERPRQPVTGPNLDEAVEQGILPATVADLLRKRGFSSLNKFQEDSIVLLNSALDGEHNGEGLLLTIGTAAGKTEAFFLPWLSRLEIDQARPGVVGLFVYPMKALQADQAVRFFSYLAHFNEGRRFPISIGLLNGDTPWNVEEVARREKAGTYRSPFSVCPHEGCGGRMRFAVDENGQDYYGSPYCENCKRIYSWLRADQESIKNFPPNLLLMTPDMLQRRLSDKFAWSSQTILGRPVHICSACGFYTPSTTRTLDGRRSCQCRLPLEPAVSLCPSLVVFDEAHLLKGMFGSNVALLISRMKAIAASYGHSPVFVATSATVAHPTEFGKQLFGGEITVLKGEELNDDGEPTRYHLFFMPVKISVLYAIGHTLTGFFVADNNADEHNRVLVFSDSKRTVYQLDNSLPEFYATESSPLIEGLSSTTRSHTADLSAEERRRIETAFDQENIRVLLATQTLEVGVDFDNLQLELQAGATYSRNDYIQRVGRAGRKRVPALVTCILNPQRPLDYYYYEHCRELVQFSEDTLDDVPLRSDNPFLIAKQVPAAVQDYLIRAADGARLMWFVREAIAYLDENESEIRANLVKLFVRSFSLEPDLISQVINRELNRIKAHLQANVDAGRLVNDLFSDLVTLPVRASDVQTPVNSDDFELHNGISLAGELDDEFEEVESDTEADNDAEVEEEGDS